MKKRIDELDEKIVKVASETQIHIDGLENKLIEAFSKLIDAKLGQ